MKPIQLTQTVQKGGCAAKIAATELRKILSHVRFPAAHPELLIDGRHFDDAAIYRVTNEIAMVQTIDFFTPIVNSPDLFGKIASCNALSDVYAMGGYPVTALAVLAFPLATMGNEVITEIMQGACDLLSAAKTNLVGGHSIDDDTLKFGLAVTGYVHPQRIWSNQGAKPGDQLILTKPLGTGSMTAALKRGVINENDMSDTLSSMTRLNNVIDFLNPEQLSAVHAATDITGFGLSGHSWQLSSASHLGLRFEFARLPIFKQVAEFIEAGILTKAHRTNQEYTAKHLKSENISGWKQHLLHDPQTSGGLLLSVDAHQAEQIVASLAPHFPGVAIIGEVLNQEAGLEIV